MNIPDTEVIIDAQYRSGVRNIFAGGFDYCHPRNTSSNIRYKFISEKHLWCVHSKYKNCLDMLNRGYQRVIVSDADTIILKNIYTHPVMNEPYDMLMRISPHVNANTDIVYKYETVFEEGFFIVRNTTHTRALMTSVCDNLENDVANKCVHIDSDTVHLGLALHSTNDINVVTLPPEMKDELLNSESYVWSGRAGAKDNVVYKEMACKYFDDRGCFGLC